MKDQVNALKLIARGLRLVADGVDILAGDTTEEKPKKEKLPALKEKSDSTKCWDAYQCAYIDRYGIDTAPLRNARVNAQIKQLIGYVGMPEAELLCSFYVTMSDSFYTHQRHPLGLLISQYQKIRTDMKLGRSVSKKEAAKSEELSSNIDEASAYLREKHGSENEPRFEDVNPSDHDESGHSEG
jgi:hypothetical protein